MVNVKRMDKKVGYKLVELSMFGSYNSSSSSDCDISLPYYFSRKEKLLMVIGSSIRLRVKDFETMYTTEEKIISLCKSIHLSS